MVSQITFFTIAVAAAVAMLLRWFGESYGHRRRLAMVPVESAGTGRALYHAGCALAANGLVALRSLVDELLQGAGALAPDDARLVATALMRSALALIETRRKSSPSPTTS